jgi:hypothetical protein
MGTLADRVCLAQPRGELVIEFLRSCDPEAMHEQTLRVRARPLDTSIDNAPLEVEIPGQGCLSRRYAGESSAAPLERDRGLRHRVAERATSLSESDEPVEKHDDLLRLVTQMSLDGPLLVHQPTVSARGLTLPSRNRLEDRARDRKVFDRLSYSIVRDALETACRNAQIAHYSPHDLRHRRVSLWFAHGIDRITVKTWSGHSRASMSSDT